MQGGGTRLLGWGGLWQSPHIIEGGGILRPRAWRLHLQPRLPQPVVPDCLLVVVDAVDPEILGFSSYAPHGAPRCPAPLSPALSLPRDKAQRKMEHLHDVMFLRQQLQPAPSQRSVHHPSHCGSHPVPDVTVTSPGGSRQARRSALAGALAHGQGSGTGRGLPDPPPPPPGYG